MKKKKPPEECPSMTERANNLENSRKGASCKYIFKPTHKIVSALLLQVLTSQSQWSEHFYLETVCKYKGKQRCKLVKKSTQKF